MKIYETKGRQIPIFIDPEAREIMYFVVSVRLSMCPSVGPLTAVPAKSNNSHYQSKLFVCVTVIS